MMKKTLAILLCGMLALMGCAGLAEGNEVKPARQTASITEVKEDGSLLCESYFGPFTVSLSDEAVVDLQGPAAPGMIVDVYYPRTDSLEPIKDVEAIRVQSTVYDATVMEVDAENAKVYVQGIASGPVWVKLPKTSDFDEIKDKTIRFYPSAVSDKPFTEEVETMDYEPVQSFMGDVTEIGDGFITMSIDGKSVRVVLTESTYVPNMPDSDQKGVGVIVKPLGDQTLPEEITALSILTGNG